MTKKFVQTRRASSLAIIIILHFSFFIFHSSAQNPTWDWVSNDGGYTSNNHLQDITVDINGNLFVAGYFGEELELGTSYFQASDIFDMYFAKFDADNNFQWAKAYGTNKQNYANGIGTDANGDVYVAGMFSETIDLGNGVTLPSLGADNDWDAYVAKFSGTDGSAIWAQSMGSSTSWDFGHSLCVDNSGNAYITGGFKYTGVFGDTSLTSTNAVDGFIAKFNTNGVFQWVQQVSGSGEQGTTDIVCDENYLYVTGGFMNESIFGTTTLTATNSNYDGFYAKYNFSGTLQSATQITGTGSIIPRSIAVDINGNTAVTGDYNGEIVINAASITSTKQQGFIVTYNNTNTYKWHKTIISSTKKGYDNTYSELYYYPETKKRKITKDAEVVNCKEVSFDTEGNLYAAGGFVDQVDFGIGSPLNAGNFNDIFIIKYNSTGSPLWIENSTFKGSGYDALGDFANGLSVGNDGSVYVAGEFWNTIGFCGSDLTCPADANHIFFAKTVSENASSENDILTFVLSEQTGAASIDTSNHTVNIEVTKGSNLTSLSPTITVSDDATINPASGASQDFSAPFEYAVTAANAESQIWTITITKVPNTENDILTFDFSGVSEDSINIDTINHSVDVVVSNGTSLTTLTPIITISDGATISPESGIYQNFTNPVTYTVTAENSITQIWTVTVSKTASANNDILTFNFHGIQEDSLNIDIANHTVFLLVPDSIDVSLLTPIITISTSASISPDSGVAQDFTNPVIYSVTAENTDVQDWTVTVKVKEGIGIEEIESSPFCISPNPSNGVFTITMSNVRCLPAEGGSDVKYQIIDITGRVVRVYDAGTKNLSPIHSPQLSINMKDQPKGIYFVKIETGNKVYTRKIILN